MPGKLSQYYSVSWMSGNFTIANSQSVFPGYQLHNNFSLTIQDIPSGSDTSYVCIVTIDDPQMTGRVNIQYGQLELGSYIVMTYGKSINE